MKRPQYQSQNWTTILPDSLAIPADIIELMTFWSERSCGLACASSAIAFQTGQVISQIKLFNQCVKNGGYSPQGWRHAELASVISEYGINAEAKPLSTDEVKESLRNGKLIIASVTHKLPETGSKGGHLILLHRLRTFNNICYVFFMDPSSWGRKRHCVQFERFKKSFSLKGILLTIA